MRMTCTGLTIIAASDNVRYGLGQDQAGTAGHAIFDIYQENLTMQDIDANTKNAIAFYREAYEGKPRNAVEKYVGAQYIQHNPLVGDGKAHFIAYFERMAAEYPEKSIEFVRSVAQGNLVALHTHQIWPDNDEYVTMDFFRFDENGKIVEHWDSIQQIPKLSAHENKMY
jgi:predicted SnoaL-like aldol condensation-catalyzing enzyme